MPNITNLVAWRLEDLAHQMDVHNQNGRPDLAELLFRSGLELAAGADEGADFLYLPDVTAQLGA